MRILSAQIKLCQWGFCPSSVEGKITWAALLYKLPQQAVRVGVKISRDILPPGGKDIQGGGKDIPGYLYPRG